MLEGSRLQPGDMIVTLQPTHIGHQPYVGAKDELRTKRVARATRAKEPKRAQNDASSDLLY